MPTDNPTGHFRLFVAIVLPETVRGEILRVQGELQPLVPREAARWSRPDQFHLTLRFLGNVPAVAVGGLMQSVEAVCRNASPLALSAKGIGFFPNPRSPRVIWAGIHDDSGRLVDLQQRLEMAVSPFNSEPGKTNFTGHVTLGRLKKPGQGEVRALAVRAQSLAAQMFGNWTAHEVVIIRSELFSPGARHTLLAAFHLGAEKI